MNFPQHDWGCRYQQSLSHAVGQFLPDMLKEHPAFIFRVMIPWINSWPRRWRHYILCNVGRILPKYRMQQPRKLNSWIWVQVCNYNILAALCRFQRVVHQRSRMTRVWASSIFHFIFPPFLACYTRDGCAFPKLLS